MPRVTRRTRRNPPLVLFHNPPRSKLAGVLSFAVLRLTFGEGWGVRFARHDRVRLSLLQDESVALSWNRKENGGLLNEFRRHQISGNLLSRNVLVIEYVHAANGIVYQHDFAPGVNATLSRAGRPSVRLYRPDGKSLYRDYPDAE